MLRCGLAVALLVSTAQFFILTHANSEESWYTSDQSKAGHQLFNNYCAECHGPDLSGGMGLALIGPTFKQRWGGKSVERLYQFEHHEMPAINPGSLTAKELLPITAYILEKNGMPAGCTALSEKTGQRLMLPE